MKKNVFSSIILFVICLLMILFLYPFFVPKESFTNEDQLENIKENQNIDILPVFQIYPLFITIPSTPLNILTERTLIKDLQFDWQTGKFNSKNFSLYFRILSSSTSSEQKIIEFKNGQTSYLKIQLKGIQNKKGYLHISQLVNSNLISDPDEATINVIDMDINHSIVLSCYTPDNINTQPLVPRTTSVTHYTLYIDGEKINDFSYGKEVDTMNTTGLQILIGGASGTKISNIRMYTKPLFTLTVSSLFTLVSKPFMNDFNRLRIEMDFFKMKQTNASYNMGSFLQIARIVVRDLNGKHIAFNGNAVNSSENMTAWHPLPDSKYIPVQSDITNISQNYPNIFHSYHGSFGDFYEIVFPVSTSIGSVTIYNRGDCCQERMESYKLTLYSVDKRAYRCFLTKDHIQSYGFESQNRLHKITTVT